MAGCGWRTLLHLCEISLPESSAAALAGELKELQNHLEGDELKRLNAAFMCFYVFPWNLQFKKNCG